MKRAQTATSDDKGNPAAEGNGASRRGPPQLMTVEECAGTLRLTVPALRQRIYRGLVPIIRIGRTIRIPASFVQELIAGAAPMNGNKTS